MSCGEGCLSVRLSVVCVCELRPGVLPVPGGRRQAMQLVRDWVEQLGLVAGSLQVLQSWEDPWSLDACSCAVSIAVRDVCQPAPR